MKVNTRINLCFVFSIIVLIVNGFNLVADILDNVEVLYIVFDIVYLVCAIGCTILFTLFKIKGIEFTKKHKKLFIVAVCLASICSLILAFIAFFAYFEIYSQRRYYVNAEKDNTIETEGRVIPTAEEITKRIKVLDEMLATNSISQEEYDRLKKEILDELVK